MIACDLSPVPNIGKAPSQSGNNRSCSGCQDTEQLTERRQLKIINNGILIQMAGAQDPAAVGKEGSYESHLELGYLCRSPYKYCNHLSFGI
jgi:hypothetical protein